MIEIKNIVKSFDDNVVLDNLNLKIEDGTILGLVGTNGVGKSTLLYMLSGVEEPTSGSILYDGDKVYNNEKVKKDIFFLPDNPYYGRGVTPYSLLKLYSMFYDIDQEVFYQYLLDFNVADKKLSKDYALKQQSLATMSKGLRRQVFVALALSIKPKYLLLDEAFDGLDAKARDIFKQAILKVQQENNMTVIISSHSLKELEGLCDQYCLLEESRIASLGYIDEAVKTYHKYNVAFKEEYLEKDFDIDFINFKSEGKVINCVVDLPYEEFEMKIKNKGYLLIEELPVDFEEFFIIKEESRREENE